MSGTYYGMPVSIAGDNIGGVAVLMGETPFPEGAVYPVPYELRRAPAGHMKIEDGKIVEKTDEEKAFSDLPIRYKKWTDRWVEMTAEEKHMVDLPAKYKHPDGSEMTDEEKAAVDVAEAAAAEEAKQQAKNDTLKKAENKFLLLCDLLTGMTAHVKLGFEALEGIISALPMEQQVVMGVKLLACDAELKREGGLRWWDDCAWHAEIVGE